MSLLLESQIADLVDEGLQLEAANQSNAVRQQEIEKLLKAHALACPDEHQPLTDKDREGTQFIARGSAGTFVRIVCTADLLVQSFMAGSATHDEISAAATASGVTVADFFQLVRMWKLRAKTGKAFRQLARESADDPERLITACIRRDKDGVPVSQVKVEWD